MSPQTKTAGDLLVQEEHSLNDNTKTTKKQAQKRPQTESNCIDNTNPLLEYRSLVELQTRWPINDNKVMHSNTCYRRMQ